MMLGLLCPRVILGLASRGNATVGTGPACCLVELSADIL